jgi:hypothetical protein
MIKKGMVFSKETVPWKKVVWDLEDAERRDRRPLAIEEHK